MAKSFLDDDDDDDEGSAEAVDSEEESVDSRIQSQPSKRKRTTGFFAKRTSYVWDHFDVSKDEEGKMRSKCKYCKNTNYRAESKYGTSNCRRHLKQCRAYEASLADAKAKTPDCAAEFDLQVYCELFADAIVTHKYPLSIVLDEKMWELLAYLNPMVNTVSKSTLLKKVEDLIKTWNEAEDGENVDTNSVTDEDEETVDTYSVAEDGEEVDSVAEENGEDVDYVAEENGENVDSDAEDVENVDTDSLAEKDGDNVDTNSISDDESL